MSPRCAGHLLGRMEPVVLEHGFQLMLAAVSTHHCSACLPVRGRNSTGDFSELERTPNGKNLLWLLADVLWMSLIDTPWFLPGPRPTSTRYVPILWSQGPGPPGQVG